MIRVLVDARALSDASAYRGIGTYLRSVLEGLGSKPDLHVSALVSRGCPLPPGIEAEPIRRIAPARWSSREHELRLPRELARRRPDVVFSPAQDPPRRCSAPWVQTIHSSLPLLDLYPELRAERERWVRMAPRLRQAAAVIAVSQHCADGAITAFGLDARRVHVIPHGVSPQFEPGEGQVSSADPYLLYVGEYGPWKGYAEAFEVIGRLAARGHPHRLRVAGRLAPWVRPQVARLVASSPDPARVELLGHVPPHALPALYRGAAALVVTSRFESFGLMSVEAMACGTPVVAFSNSGTTEVVRTGGVLVDDGKVSAFTDAVESVIVDDVHRATLSAAGIQRARAFSWTRAVAAHADVLETAAQGSSR